VSDERSGDDLLQQPRMIARNATMTNHVRAGRARSGRWRFPQWTKRRAHSAFGLVQFNYSFQRTRYARC
jgi:hypothetical protein